MQMKWKTHISLLCAIESPVAQWLEQLTRLQSAWIQILSEAQVFQVPNGFYQHLIWYVKINSAWTPKTLNSFFVQAVILEYHDFKLLDLAREM